MSSTGKAKKKKTGRQVFSVFRKRDNKSQNNDDKNNNDSFRTVNVSTNDQTPLSLPSTISPKLKTLLDGMNSLADAEINELRKLGVTIQSPTANNPKSGKTKGKTNRQVANLAINMNDNPNQNQGKTNRQTRAETRNNSKKEVSTNVATAKITDGSINVTTVQAKSNDSKDQQEVNHDSVPTTIEPMTTPLPTGDQTLSTSSNDDDLQDDQVKNEENITTVKAFEKTTKGIENPMFVKPIVNEKKGLLPSLSLPIWPRKDANKVATDPTGSSSSPIRVPIVPAACYSIVEVDSDVLPDKPTGFAYDLWDPIQHFEAAMRLLAEHDILGIHAVYVPSLTKVVEKTVDDHIPKPTWPVIINPSILLEGGLNHDVFHSIVSWMRDVLLDHNH